MAAGQRIGSAHEVKIIIKALADVAKIDMSERKLRKLGITVDETGKIMDSVSKRGLKMRDVLGRMEKNARRFRMEQLGIMFMGMAVTRMFGQMTSQAVEWLGIGEMLNLSLNLIAFEALEPMADGIYKVIDGLFDLSDSTKESLGQLMLFGQASGLVMQTVGQLILGLSSLAMVFPSMRIPIAGAVGALLGEFGGAIGEVLGIAGPAGKAIGDVFKAIGELGPVGGAVAGVVTTVGLDIAYSALAAKFFGATSGKWLKGSVNTKAGLSTSLGSTFKNFFSTAGKWLKGSVKTTARLIASLGSIFVNFFSTAGAWKLKSVKTTIMLVIPNFLKWLAGLPVIRLVVQLLPRIGGAIAGGIGAVAGGAAALLGGAIGVGGVFFKNIADAMSSITGGAMYGGGGGGGGVTLQHGGVVPGRFGEPVPMIGHGGERFEGIHGRGTENVVNFYATYNISGAGDKTELERMLRDNNDRVVSDIKRLVAA